MTYQKFVQIGRVVFVAYGPDKGKTAVIVDVVDQNRCLIDGPRTGVARQVLNLKLLQLTKFMVKIGPGARTATVTKAWDKADISPKWAKTNWAKRIENNKIRANMTDFDRFKLMKAKQARRGIQSQLFGRAKKSLKESSTKSKK